MTTKFVKAVIPVLGLSEGQEAELTDSPYLQKVIGAGWLQQITKTEAKKSAASAGVLPQTVDPDIAVVKE